MTNVALAECSARSFKPVSVCVMDASGRVLVSKTMVACATLAPELAHAKDKIDEFELDYMIRGIGDNWNAQYNAIVFDQELKLFLVDHLDDKAA